MFMKLADMLHRDRSRLKHSMLISQGKLCAYCDRPMNDDPRDHIRFATFDHIIALAEGGKDDLENLTLACRPCNTAKSCMSPDELREMADRIELLIDAVRGKDAA
jgi:5-methylcytosine-specific restriction endonuclease McrA